MVEQRTSIAAADPYLLFGLLGKRVIHPGGRKATEQLFGQAELSASHEVLDIGCGVGTTAVEIARRFGSRVVAADISVDMRERAAARAHKEELGSRVSVEAADICALPFADGRFDRVVAEAVTMFVDRDLAIRELVRVCRPGGLVLATEFQWRRPPTPEARQAFLGVQHRSSGLGARARLSVRFLPARTLLPMAAGAEIQAELLGHAEQPVNRPRGRPARPGNL